MIGSWFDATAEEREAIFALVDEVKRQLDAGTPRPDGYNIGINVGAAAGQTVMHLHVHVIPRYAGDVEDPRGGVRHVIPGRGNYVVQAPSSLATGGADPFQRHLDPLFASAREVAIIAAFVQESGLDLLKEALLAALERGGRVRLVTGDYLHITQASALERLHAWSSLHRGFEARVVETERLPGSGRSFHPKSWRFESETTGVAFVGSSNVSRSALRDGIEWNLRLERGRDPDGYQRVVEEFERWWEFARPLDAAWLADYAQRAIEARFPAPGHDIDVDPVLAPPVPHDVQREALIALRESREENRRRALVVMATGLGKTILAALDVQAVARELGRLPRVLLLAHREELLDQAARTFRRVLRPDFPGLSVSFFVGDASDLDGDLVLASVQKLCRPEHLAALAHGAFDYAIVDEVHHAAAKSYRVILDRLEPRFLLGLTATPERADGADVVGLFDDHVPYRADLGEGIARGLLVPFAYHGLKDDVDYENIPWRNRRFDPEALSRAVETERRMERLLETWQEHTGTRTLVFCCSVSHAGYASRWLCEHGVRAVAVHSGPDSHDRVEALEQLKAGRLDALCAVDLFNEGVDVPDVDRVVMLRPTESMTVFLQQLGRGLRVSAGKERLTVIDFVGNHRVFHERVRALLSLASREPGDVLRRYLEGQDVQLPLGCAMDVEFEAKELLARLLPKGRTEIEAVFRELLEARERRPTVGELFWMGYRPSTLRERYRSWFGFAREMGALEPEEERVFGAASAWFEELEHREAMTKSFKMVTIEALLEANALGTGLPLTELARRSHAILARDPGLFAELEGLKDLPDPDDGAGKAFASYWRKNPITAWTGGDRKARAWFAIDGDRFVPRIPLPPGNEATFAEMTAEVVDYRLAMYRDRLRRQREGDDGSFVAKVISNGRDPILMLPKDGRPTGETTVRLPNGTPWSFRFVKIACNVARAPGSTANGLPDLLRRWFGPGAGRPGTAFQVRFSKSPDGYWAEPLGQVIAFPARGRVVAYPSLRVAAGAVQGSIEEPPEADEVRLPGAREGLFAVRASGDSMDGGAKPIRDGDWLLFRPARGEGLGAVAGRVALVQVPENGGFAYQVKRVVKEGQRILLRSDNPERAPFDANKDTVVIAVLVDVVRPEGLAPVKGTKLGDEALAAGFGLDAPPRPGRNDGHLFLFVEGKGAFVEPDRLVVPIDDRRPGETAYVLARAAGDEPWTYVGVARWIEPERRWDVGPLDFDTWRALGEGREASRRLPAGALDRAREFVDGLVSRVGKGGWLEANGQRCRVVGRADRGGVRIDGGPGGFAPRTVSLVDIAWVLVARGEIGRTGLLDEAVVNRHRYLEGTPKASTRWIDTGWALTLLAVDEPG